MLSGRIFISASRYVARSRFCRLYQCGALREAGGSVRCRSCRRHNVKKRKADAAIAARLGSAGEAPVNPSPTARHITGGSQQGAYFPSGPVWKPTSELGYTSRRWRGAPVI